MLWFGCGVAVLVRRLVIVHVEVGGAVVNDSRVVQRFCGSGGDVRLWRYDGGGLHPGGRGGVVVLWWCFCQCGGY